MFRIITIALLVLGLCSCTSLSRQAAQSNEQNWLEKMAKVDQQGAYWQSYIQIAVNASSDQRKQLFSTLDGQKDPTSQLKRAILLSVPGQPYHYRKQAMQLFKLELPKMSKEAQQSLRPWVELNTEVTDLRGKLEALTKIDQQIADQKYNSGGL
ncbi:hypothetical protein [Dongshaea marina]|uniref:hypothetical protein n=1 Tax=Dongshaea marina TaxID=2047966 RepID=UPI00131F045A|nr:hypothetical protein [Dongshaea marina]